MTPRQGDDGDNGYDYDLQVWVVDGVIAPCGHPDSLRRFAPCCEANRLHGLTPKTAKRWLRAFGGELHRGAIGRE